MQILLDGLLGFSWWQILIAALVLTHITIVSVTVYLHRYSAHRAIELHPIVQHFFRFWLWLTTGMTTKAWTAVHRKHHAKCETAEDPHSPQVKGIDEVLWRGAELYKREAKNSATLDSYGQGTPNDWIERNLYSRYDALGVSLLLILDVALFGVIGLTVWAVQMLWIPFWAAGIINGVGHYWGYRNFEVPDASRNILPWGILVGGEELHNNHHTYATSAKFSVKPWEFDIGWNYIRLMRKFKLARVNKVPPELYQQPKKSQVDGDTVLALLMNKFNILSQYHKKVVFPLIKQEAAKADKSKLPLFRRAQQLLSREEILIDEADRYMRAQLLQQNQVLEVIYRFRLELLAIWAKTTQNKNDLVKALKDWCQQAEQSGIQALEDFALLLKTYSVQKASA